MGVGNSSCPHASAHASKPPDATSATAVGPVVVPRRGVDPHADATVAPAPARWRIRRHFAAEGCAWRGSGLTPESTHNAYPTRAAGRGRSRQSCVSASGSAEDARFFFFFFFFFSEPSSDLARFFDGFASGGGGGGEVTH